MCKNSGFWSPWVRDMSDGGIVIVAVSYAPLKLGDCISMSYTGGKMRNALTAWKSCFKYKRPGYYPVHMSLSSNPILEQDWLNHLESQKPTDIVSQAVQCVEVAFEEEKQSSASRLRSRKKVKSD